MTLEMDNFLALSGVVKQLQRVTPAQYIAGLWHNDLLKGLLWETYDPLAGVLRLGELPLGQGFNNSSNLGHIVDLLQHTRLQQARILAVSLKPHNCP